MGMGKGKPVGTGGSLPEGVVQETTADVTYYVRTTGDDSNDGLTEGTALRQISAALVKIPRDILHTMVIDVEAGEFNGYDVTGRNFLGTGSLTISGVLGAPTLTGATTGTGEAGSDQYQIVDSTASWDVNELEGKLVKVGSNYRPAYANTADTVQFVGYFGSTTEGQAYEILEPKTVCNTTSISGSIVYCSNISAQSSSAWTIENMYLDGATAGATFGMIAYNVIGGVQQNCVAFDTSYTGFLYQLTRETNARQCVAQDCSVYGFWYLKTPSVRQIQNCFSFDNGSHGFSFDGSGSISGDWYSAKGNGGNGLYSNNSTWIDLDGGQFEDNTGYGIRVGFTGGNLFGNSVLSANCPATRLKLGGNDDGGVLVEMDCKVYLDGATGTADGAYGVTANSAAQVYIGDNIDVTGATGDATINGGSTTLTWATDFASNGDKAINLDDLSYMERRD